MTPQVTHDSRNQYLASPGPRYERCEIEEAFNIGQAKPKTNNRFWLGFDTGLNHAGPGISKPMDRRDDMPARVDPCNLGVAGERGRQSEIRAECQPQLSIRLLTSEPSIRADLGGYGDGSDEWFQGASIRHPMSNRQQDMNLTETHECIGQRLRTGDQVASQYPHTNEEYSPDITTSASKPAHSAFRSGRSPDQAPEKKDQQSEPGDLPNGTYLVVPHRVRGR
ncbi:MAG: hypothetical protein Q9173_002440 [Seirophora scorigena]